MAFDPDAYLAKSTFDPDAYLESGKKDRSWSDVPLEALKNAPASAGRMIGGIYQSVRHPIDTASTLLDAAAGGLQNITPAPLREVINKIDPNPQSAQRAERVAGAVGQMYKDRYGSIEGIKETISTDPVGFAGDVSTVFSAGASLAPKASKAAQILNSGAQYTNPLNALAPIVSYAGDKISPLARSGAERLMQSSLKPTIEQLRTGKAATAVNTLLDEGINPTRGGVEKLRERIGSVNDDIANAIQSSKGTVDKQMVLDALSDTKDKFRTQVSPTSDLNAIENVATDFTNHPLLKSDQIPVQLAQELKQGTYKTLSKKYGQVGSAETEAQKGLARGLKEGIAEAVPEVAGLNARESALINTLSVAERRALMDANKNPMGPSLLAQNPATWAAFMADKSALFKSLSARMLNQASKPNKLADVVKGATPGQNKLMLLLNQAGQQPQNVE